MKRSREERQNHLKLDEDCIEIGGYDSREYRGLLAHYLGTEIPTHEKKKYMLCHACNNHKCSNPRHVYWGTTADNMEDQKMAGTWKSFYQRTIEKHGLEKTREIQQAAGRKLGKANKGKKLISKEQEQKYISTIKKYLPFKHGDLCKMAKELDISHTHARRLVEKHYPKITK